MPYVSENIPIAGTQFDKRIKLTDKQREEIRLFYFSEYNGQHIHSTRQLARMFHVDKRTIQFVLYPERKDRVAQRAIEVKRWKPYNRKEYHTPAMRKHRAHKHQLYLEGKIHREEAQTGNREGAQQ